MSARRDLILAAMRERALEGDLTPEIVADAVEDAIRDLPAVPFVAILRLAYAPNQGEIPRLTDLAAKIEKDTEAVTFLVLSDDADWETLDDEQLLRCGLARVDTIHRCPPDGRGLMPCCGRTPFEAPRHERITTDPALVTCKGPES